MFYNRMNAHIVQVFSSCERVIKVVKRLVAEIFQRLLIAS